ncbi:MAG TPA: hypothetical protein PKD61_33600, partial [Polyangiaceae bacterium]|nr:hypothetical protein [Polyangiaceae bacterium]
MLRAGSMLACLVVASCAGRSERPPTNANAKPPAAAKGTESSALAAYRRACDLGSARGCNDLGVAYLDGDGVPKNEGRAIPLLRRSCEMALPMGCANLAHALANGLGTEPDPGAAARHYSDACTGGVGWACGALADMVMGETAEKLAPDLGITREAQDRDAVATQRRAGAAI